MSVRGDCEVSASSTTLQCVGWEKVWVWMKSRDDPSIPLVSWTTNNVTLKKPSVRRRYTLTESAEGRLHLIPCRAHVAFWEGGRTHDFLLYCVFNT